MVSITERVLLLADDSCEEGSGDGKLFNMILPAKLSYELRFLITDTGSQMVIAVKSIDITVNIETVPKTLEDMKQSDRIRTS